jgi:DNA polymerase III delta subunit
MLYLLHGENFKESRKKLHSLVESLLKKEPNASQFHIDNENFCYDLLKEMIGSIDLFVGKYIVVVDKIFEDKENGDAVLKELKEIANSENIFIFIEEKLNKTILARFKKWAEKIQEFTEKETKKQEQFNVFSITDALGKRDKRGMWVLYQKALMSGVVPEELHGIIFWQTKNILMVKNETNPGGLGLNPFVLRKSLSFAKNFKKDELVKLSRELVEIPHNARRGLEDFDISLEKFILRL